MKYSSKIIKRETIDIGNGYTVQKRIFEVIYPAGIKKELLSVELNKGDNNEVTSWTALSEIKIGGV